VSRSEPTAVKPSEHDSEPKLTCIYPVFSAVFDLYLALYPSIVLMSLQMNLRKKLGLSTALGFGYWYVSLLD